MKLHIRHIAVAATVIASLAATAQNRSAYFLDNYAYNYQHNPAMALENRKRDASFPFLGSFNVGTRANVGVRDFFYVQKNGKMTTFLNPEVSASEFLDKLNTHNRIGVELNEQIFSYGFRALGGYNHVSIGLKADAQIRLPKSIFSFLKEGVTNNTYDIGRLDANVNAYAEIALNHSHSLEHIVPGLRVGGSFKFLIGLANLDLNLDKADLELGTDNWRAVTNGTIRVNFPGIRYKTSTNKENEPYVDGVKFDGFGIGGYGLAIDLGATYRLNKDWDFALAFNDIGFINWKDNWEASTNGDRIVSTNDYPLNADDFDDSMDALTDALSSLYQLSDNGNTGSRCRALAGTMNASVRYTLPVYRQLTFGLLNTTHMSSHYSWTEFRLSANVTPVKWLGLGVNYGLGTFGSSFGWILNIAPKGFNLFVGMDHTVGKLSKQFIPLNLNTQLSFGINFPI